MLINRANGMRFAAILIATMLTTNAASAGNVYWKRGLSQEAMLDDQMECKIRGNQGAPADREPSGYDRNFELRMRIIGKCMKERGYKAVKVRACGPFKKMPDTEQTVEITNKTCYKGVEYGYVFVN